jgi:hypothetical protein
MNTCKIKFTAVSIGWTEGGIMHMRIKATAESKISIAWGDGRVITHFFNDETEIPFSHNYYPKIQKNPPDGVPFCVEISSDNPDCCIIGFSLGGDMNANDLDLKNCTELEELSLDVETESSSFDLSRNTALKRLSFNAMHITSLDLTNNTALEELHCRSTRLKHLSLTTNCALKYLYCEFNGIEKIFIYYAPQLTVAEFEEGNNIDDETRMRIQGIIAENELNQKSKIKN